MSARDIPVRVAGYLILPQGQIAATAPIVLVHLPNGDELVKHGDTIEWLRVRRGPMTPSDIAELWGATR